MIREQVRLCFSGRQRFELLSALADVRLIPQGEIEELSFDGQRLEPVPEDWLRRAIREQQQRVHANFPDYQLFSTDKLTVLTELVLDLDLEVLLRSLGQVAFELMSSSALHRRWRKEGYRGPSFADGHAPHGWACAFRGAGHDRLVSRRWLDYGPWRLIRDDEHDISFVQFHDLDADAETALEQARPGHQRMGISDTGGFVQKTCSPHYELRGFYVSDEQVLEVVVAGRELSQDEMLEACQARFHQVLGPDKPLRNVRYVFLVGEAAARSHLHELWLRELECWAIVAGNKVRLDDTYQPPPPARPQWVLDVEAREDGDA